MRFAVFCTVCAGQQVPGLYLGEVGEDWVCRAKCVHGHDIVTAFQMHRFEMLFEFGLYAVLDGYLREAVASIHAAYERFCEFYVRVICRKETVVSESVERAWKEVRRQSERQLGAYVFVHLLTRKEPPPFLPQRAVEFRNAVFHQGMIPTRGKTVQYAQDVFDAINPVLEYLKETDHDQALNEATAHLSLTDRRLPVMGMLTMLCTIKTSPPRITSIDQYLVRLKQHVAWAEAAARTTEPPLTPM